MGEPGCRERQPLRITSPNTNWVWAKPTLHPSLFTLHSSLFTPHSSLSTLHSSLSTLHSPLFTLHSSLLQQKRQPQKTVAFDVLINLLLTLNAAGGNAFNVVLLHVEEQCSNGNSNNNGAGEEVTIILGLVLSVRPRP